MAERPYRCFPPIAPANQLAMVTRIALFARLSWPSGRDSVETLAGAAVVSDLERAVAVDPDALQAVREANLKQSLDELATNIESRAADGWWLRRRRNGRYRLRRIAGLEWMAA